MGNNVLRYTAPSEAYVQKDSRAFQESLPIGNGTLGGMIFGGKNERIALNHENLYTGKFKDRDSIRVKKKDLNEIRRLLLEGKYGEGIYKATKTIETRGGIAGHGHGTRVDPYQPAGDLYITTGLDDGKEISDYLTELTLDDATVTTSFKKGNNTFKREYRALHGKDKFISIVLSSARPTSYGIKLDRIKDKRCVITRGHTDDTLSLYGKFIYDNTFTVTVKVMSTDGEVTITDKSLKIAKTKRVWLLLGIDVGTAPKFPKITFPGKSLETLNEQHIKAYSSVYTRCRLNVEGNPDKEALTTPERIAQYRKDKGATDPTMPVLYFNYGRYLFISSCGQLPPHLQGIWNDEIDPPWECDFHNDINLEMNFWSAEPTGMGDYTDSLFNLCEKFIESGRETAKRLYHCEGTFLPLCSDANGRATSDSQGWGVWVSGAPWMCEHYWMHYEYSCDEEFLKNRAYPYFKEVAAFICSYVVKDGNGYSIVPSQSPENTFVHDLNGYEKMPVSLCKNAAMDVTFFRQVLEYSIKSSELLGIDETLRRKWKRVLKKLPELQIGKNGRLLEWGMEVEEGEPGHRHFSPLIGMFPTDYITPEDTPELFKAGHDLFEHRLSAGGGHTGWSRSWTACLYARSGEGDKAYEHLTTLIADFATSSLLDLHPPRIFQIDGNFGGTAAVAEMLIQSYKYRIRLLPALPSGWKTGEYSGLHARGGFTVGCKWADGKLTSATVTSCNGGDLNIYADGRTYDFTVNGKAAKAKKRGNLYTLATNKGDEIEITVK